MHEHKDCDHVLRYCTKCDVVFCEKCNKEWIHHAFTFQPNTMSTVYPKYGTVIYCTHDRKELE